jgi:hypothetical protein
VTYNESRAVDRLSLIVAVSVWLAFPVAVSAQQAPERDPTAVALVRQALAQLAGGTDVRDVALEASATYAAGSDEESGTATLVARGSQESRVVLNLDGGQHQEIRRGPQGIWSGPGGQAHSISTHNTWTDAGWFFPALTLQGILRDPQLTLVYVGDELRDSSTVHHLRVSRLLPGQDAPMTARIERLSTTEVFLDAGSLLPVALAFATHPDKDAGRDIAVEIQFRLPRGGRGESAFARAEAGSGHCDPRTPYQPCGRELRCAGK